jgi:hypothetical protein
MLALRIFKEISTIKGETPHWGQCISSFRSGEPHIYTHLLGYSPTFHLITWPQPGTYSAAHMKKLRKEFDPNNIWPVSTSHEVSYV